MKVMGLDLIKTEQQNLFYNPRLCHNGGGYDQPEFTYRGPAGKLVISDSSCGEFGARYCVAYTDVAGQHHRYFFDEVDRGELESGGIPRKYDGIIRFCAQQGYPVRAI